VDYLQDNEDAFTVYQPITIVQPTAAITSPGSRFVVVYDGMKACILTDVVPLSAYSGNTDNGLGTVMLEPVNSYTFVNMMMTQLASFGVDLTTFLNVSIV
jgi:hypothetical protein